MCPGHFNKLASSDIHIPTYMDIMRLRQKGKLKFELSINESCEDIFNKFCFQVEPPKSLKYRILSRLQFDRTCSSDDGAIMDIYDTYLPDINHMWSYKSQYYP